MASEQPLSTARHLPQLIKLGGVALAHHLPSHSPIRIGRYAGRSKRPPAPAAIDLIKDGHHLRSLGWLRYGEEIVGVLTRLAKVQQHHFRLPDGQIAGQEYKAGFVGKQI